MKRTIFDLMKQVDLSRVPTISIHATVEEGLWRLEDYEAGALLVMNNSEILGVFSERDFARAAIYSGEKSVMSQSIANVMSRKIVYVTPDYTVEECMAIMVKMKIRHLPVVGEKGPLALLSMRHIMKALVDDKEFMITQLVNYITGSPASNHDTSEEKRGPLVLLPSIRRPSISA